MKFNHVFSVFAALGLYFGFQGIAAASISTTGLSMWLDATKGVTVSGSNVTSWTDQSGNGHNASQSSTVAQPTFASNGINGNPAIQFSGSGQSLAVTGQVITSPQFTILAVVTDTNSAFYQEIFSNWSSTNSTTSVFLGVATLSATKARFTDQMGGQVDGNILGVGSLSNPSTPFIFTGLSGGSDATIYQNSNAIADKGSALTGRDLTGQYNIGTQGGFEFWGGDLGALLVYNRALSSSELQQDWAALDQEFGLPNAGAVPEPSPLIVWSVLGVAGFVFLGIRRRTRIA